MFLRDKSAVITGGGRGIGAAIARSLAEAGARVVVSARSTDEIEAVASELVVGGYEAHAVPCDVSDPASVGELARRAEAAVGPAQILINNAGIAAAAPLQAIELEAWQRIFAVNVTGTMLCTQAFVPGMVAGGWGRVINIASIAGKRGGPYISAYAASKHAVIGFTRSVALEVARKGVTVNAVCPGYVETSMTERSVANIIDKTGLAEAEAREKLYEMSPQHRVFSPQEVAYVTVSLCDERAGGVNGQSVVLDGGEVQA